MLIEFTVSNFRSIKEPQTLSMLATSLKEHPDNVFQSPDPNIKLLKTAVIYGANASGKSNVIEAFQVFKNLVSKTNSEPDAEIALYEPFFFDTEAQDKPTSFEVEFFGKDNLRYNYKIIFNKIGVDYEALFYYPKGQKAKLFERKKDQKGGCVKITV